MKEFKPSEPWDKSKTYVSPEKQTVAVCVNDVWTLFTRDSAIINNDGTNDKIKVIDEICKRHPSAGVEKGWSEYTGGMKDTGRWFFRKMLDVPIKELQDALDALIQGENKKPIPLTEQEKIDEKTFVQMGNMRISVAEQKRMKAHKEDVDAHMWDIMNDMTKSIQK